MTGPDTARGFGLYVHWPFCASKCPYCDFNSHVRERIDQARWRAALLQELDHAAQATQGRQLTSIFFGGGTPSLMAPETAGAVIARAREHWPFADGIEITLEANPGSVETKRFAELARAGINRVSLGVQALDDDALAFLGRKHSVAEAMTAIDTAREHFGRWSFDLIYARPGQSVEAWRGELARALQEKPEHISVYQLTIEEGTAFHGAVRRGEITMPDEDTTAALYEVTQDILEQAGMPAYEISNHARPGQESRHNLTYWRYEDYAGVGPGAHGRITLPEGKFATRQHRAPEAWLDAVEREGHATRARTLLTHEDRLSEFLMMGLRLREGVTREAFRHEFDRDIEEALPRAALRALIGGGFLKLDDSGLRATAEGRARLNAVLAHLL